MLLFEKTEDLIIAANFDRTFRSAASALLTISDFRPSSARSRPCGKCAAAVSMRALRDAIPSKAFAISRETVTNIFASNAEAGAA
jgi:hypothetical protein